jgi:FKBP-type peptidyl-prolyl cis-trans isomerase FkpA
VQADDNSVAMNRKSANRPLARRLGRTQATRNDTVVSRIWTAFTVLGLISCLPGSAIFAADDNEPKKEETKKVDPQADAKVEDKEVDLPAMPKKAGKVDKDAPKKFTKTKSGLKYRILRKGDDKKKPGEADMVEVNYHGWLDGGKVFDSSYDRGEPIEFPLNRVIPGWSEGMQLVGKGGMIELEIPADLGYGARGAGGRIPPNATLHFVVELQQINGGDDDSADDDKEVALPKLPTGAGKLDQDPPKKFTKTKSGLKYRILRKGDDKKKPKEIDTVEVNYHGWLDNGKVFDSSYERREPIEFPLNQVIPGWTEGMQLVGKGGMIELEIPARLGYGNRGAGNDIPPKSRLHFLVELLDVK